VGIDFTFKESQKIKGVWIIIPTVSADNRGNIWTSFLQNEIGKLLPDGLLFKHDKFSISKLNVLRGIHGDEKSWKLVTCVYGSIQQVVVDCRRESDTYLSYESFQINQENQLSVLIPPLLGNAYYVKSKKAVYHYKLAYQGDYIDADKQFSFKWNKPEFNIKWDAVDPILSERDNQ
jgi:dTDP-4-dehydrorhamnose 3,5-epimerase